MEAPQPFSVARMGSSASTKRKLNDEYFVQKVQLGTGSFGVVHRAIHKPSQADRAVKSIDKRRLELKPVHRLHLQREIEILRECVSHENIVKLYDWFEDDQYIHLVLEYCGGGDLGDKILQTKSNLPEKTACEWTYQILHAIEYLHSKNICHRDIKPENFLISSGTLKLSDFGMAIRCTTLLRDIAGTPAYQAPEIHNLNSLPAASGSDFTSVGYSKSVDLWACGVTLFVILSGGANPFVSKDKKLQLQDLKQGVVRFDELGRRGGRKGSDDYSVSRKPVGNAENLLRLLLTVDPTRRPAVADALAHPWFIECGLAAPPLQESRSMDSSLEASPPAMELILAAPRGKAASFELNIEEDDFGPSLKNYNKSPLSVPARLNSQTIGPGGGKEGKVVRCDKCGAFFYSQRGATGVCPECRVQLGYTLPADGIGVGTFVYFQKNKQWTGAKISKFVEQTGEFELEDGVRVAANAVAPPGRDTGPGAPWSKGTNVLYLSATYGTWLPAYIEGFSEGTRQYDLDVKAGVNGDKIRARVKRLTK